MVFLCIEKWRRTENENFFNGNINTPSILSMECNQFSLVLYLVFNFNFYGIESQQQINIFPGNGPKSGENILIFASSTPIFSSIDSTPRIRIGGTSCEATSWYSATMLTCITPSGASSAAAVVISFASLSLGNLYPVELDSVNGNKLIYTYDGATIQTESSLGTGRSNIPREAGQIILVTGQNFAVSDWTLRLSVGSTVCEASVWYSDTSLSCKIVASAQKAVPLTLTINNQIFKDCDVNRTGQCASSFSFDQFSILSVFPYNGVSGGDWMLTISGLGFGTFDSSVKARLTPQDGNPSAQTDCATSVWISDTSIACTMPRGDASYLGVSLTVTGVQGTLDSCLSYNNFKVIGFAPHSAGSAADTALSIFGTSFGYSPTKARAVRLGDTACRSSTWTSDSAMSCLVPRGYGTELFPTITVDYPSNPYLETDQGDERLYFSYDAPRIDAVAVPNASPLGGGTVTILGYAFGVWDMSPIAIIGDTASPKVSRCCR